MSTSGAPVRFSDDDMDVKFWRAALVQSHVAQQRKHFDLFFDRDTFVIPLFELKKSEHAIRKCADCGNLARGQSIFFRKVSKPANHLVASIKHHHPFFQITAVYEFGFHSHSHSPSRPTG